MWIFSIHSFDFETYNSYEDIIKYINNVAQNPDQFTTDDIVEASIEKIGTTYELRKIKMLKLSLKVSQN